MQAASKGRCPPMMLSPCFGCGSINPAPLSSLPWMLSGFRQAAARLSHSSGGRLWAFQHHYPAAAAVASASRSRDLGPVASTMAVASAAFSKGREGW